MQGDDIYIWKFDISYIRRCHAKHIANWYRTWYSDRFRMLLPRHFL